MELMKKALDALHHAESRFHELINPAEHIAEKVKEVVKGIVHDFEAWAARLVSVEQRLKAMEEDFERRVSAAIASLTGGAAPTGYPTPTTPAVEPAAGADAAQTAGTVIDEGNAPTTPQPASAPAPTSTAETSTTEPGSPFAEPPRP